MKIYDLQQRINRIASNIKSLRLQRGYSQEYMGAKLNMSQNTFSKIELGHVELTVKRLIEIAEVLEIDVHDLICLINSRPYALIDEINSLSIVKEVPSQRNPGNNDCF